MIYKTRDSQNTWFTNCSYVVIIFAYLFSITIKKDKFENTKGVMESHKSKKDRQYNDQKIILKRSH
jgi:hypothetical protein